MMQKVEICGVNTSGLPKLTQKESEELMKRLKEGDEEAREQFVVGNMRLVLSLVKRFWAKRANADDVFQAGCIGLLKAIDNFDLRVGVKFSTYAVPMIMGEIKRYLRDGNSLRVSRSIRDTAYRVLKTRESIEEKDEEATIEKIAETMNVALKEVVYALDAISDPVSLFEPVFNQSGDALMLMDQIYDEKNNDEVWTEHAALSEAMTRQERATYALGQTAETFKKVFPFILLGVAIGALIHNWIPQDIVEAVLGDGNPFAVVLATLIGAPIYADIFGTIPIAEALFGKGVGLGTILAFMMSVTVLSIPSLTMLSRVVKPKLLATFVGICLIGMIISGYVFNWLQPLFV